MFVEGKTTEYNNLNELVDSDEMAIGYAQDGGEVVWYYTGTLQDEDLMLKPYIIKFQPETEKSLKGVITMNVGTDRLDDGFYLVERPATLDEMTVFALRLQREDDLRAQAAVEFVQEKIVKAATDLGGLAIFGREE